MNIWKRIQDNVRHTMIRRAATNTPWPIRSARKGPYPVAATISFFLFLTAFAVAVNVARTLEIGA